MNRERWQEIEADIDTARIGTIHSLCEAILRAHPAEAGIDHLVVTADGAEPANRPKEIAKEGLSEYFIYTIEGTETIRNGWSKRMRSLVRGITMSSDTSPRRSFRTCRSGSRAESCRNHNH